MPRENIPQTIQTIGHSRRHPVIQNTCPIVNGPRSRAGSSKYKGVRARRMISRRGP